MSVHDKEQSVLEIGYCMKFRRFVFKPKCFKHTQQPSLPSGCGQSEVHFSCTVVRFFYFFLKLSPVFTRHVCNRCGGVNKREAPSSPNCNNGLDQHVFWSDKKGPHSSGWAWPCSCSCSSGAAPGLFWVTWWIVQCVQKRHEAATRDTRFCFYNHHKKKREKN